MTACPRNQYTAQPQNQSPSQTPLDVNSPVTPVNDVRDFSIEYLQSISGAAGGVFSPHQNVWDVEAYKKYEQYFPLTAEEENIVGSWIPIPDESWTSNQEGAEDFAFWPNKLCIVGFGPGYMIGLWSIKDDQLFVTMYGISYPSGEQGYVKESLKPFTVKVINVSDISTVGYSRRRFDRVPVPSNIAQKFSSILEKRAYYFKALVSFDPSAGFEYRFMYRMQEFIDAGNPSAEDIVTLTMNKTPSELGETSPLVGVHFYVRDEIVTLRAYDIDGIFTHWQGDASGTDAITTLVMDTDKAVTAVFDPDGLSVHAVGGTYLATPAGQSATFAVVVYGDIGPLSYQWYRITEDKAAVLIPDAVESSYTVFDISEADAGDYQCEVYDHGRSESAWSPVFTLVLSEAMPVSGLMGAAAVGLAMAFAGARMLKKRRG